MIQKWQPVFGKIMLKQKLMHRSALQVLVDLLVVIELLDFLVKRGAGVQLLQRVLPSWPCARSNGGAVELSTVSATSARIVSVPCAETQRSRRAPTIFVCVPPP